MSAFRRPRSPAPGTEGLVAVRRSLFRLHKTLIDAERRWLERRRGAVTSGEFLQALIHDPELAWLQPFTTVIVEIDEALAEDGEMTPGQAREYVLRVKDLIEPGEAAVAEHYAQVRQSDPEVLVAHVELEANIGRALE